MNSVQWAICRAAQCIRIASTMLIGTGMVLWFMRGGDCVADLEQLKLVSRGRSVGAMPRPPERRGVAEQEAAAAAADGDSGGGPCRTCRYARRSKASLGNDLSGPASSGHGQGSLQAARGDGRPRRAGSHAPGGSGQAQREERPGDGGWDLRVRQRRAAGSHGDLAMARSTRRSAVSGTRRPTSQ